MRKRTATELREFSPRLLHDVQVFFGVARALARSGLGFGRPLSWEAQTAMVESFALHARGLSDFFYTFKGSRHETDAFAMHFFQEREWERLAPEQGVWLRQISHRPLKGSSTTRIDRFGSEIAHLNYSLPPVSDLARGWPVMQAADELGRVLWAFVLHVDDEKVTNDFKRRAISQVPVAARIQGKYLVRALWTRSVTIEAAS